jgi:hypothetical protein
LVTERHETLRQEKELHSQEKRSLAGTGSASFLEATNLASPLDAPRQLLSAAAAAAIRNWQQGSSRGRRMQDGTVSQVISQVMPLEADPVEALIISLDRIYQHR